MKRLVFFKNTMILTFTSLLLRTIGMFFRVYLSNKIGSEGIGLYQLIFSVYILATTFATSGLSVSVTRLLSEAPGRKTRQSVSRVLKKALLFSVFLGFLAALALFFGAGPIGNLWLRDARAVPALKILAPSLPFMSASACLYGYFISCRRVAVTSGSQIMEQLIRISVTVFLLNRFQNLGIAYACAAVMLGSTLADAAACLHLYIEYRIDLKRHLPAADMPFSSDMPVIRKILSIAAPIAAGSYLTTILRTIENLLVPNCLTKFNSSREKALSEFGMLKGMAMPVLFFPSSFLTALSILIIPEISELYASKQTAKLQQIIKTALQISITMSLLAGGLFTLYSRDLGLLLYKSEEVGFYIKVLGPVMPFIYIESIIDGMLKGLNQQVSSLRYNLIDSVARISLIFALVPGQGMKGFLFVMLVSNLLVNLLNFRRLLYVTKIRLDFFKLAVLPLLSLAAAAGITVILLGQAAVGGAFLNARDIALRCLTVTGIYVFLLFLTGCLKTGDLIFLRRRKRA